MAENTTIKMVDDFAVILRLIPLKCKLSSNKWEEIHLHALPTNYGMLMMNIDYPGKAKDNPNGSLFMLPSKEILLDTASDIGLLYFGGKLDWYGIYNYKPEKGVKESLLDLYGNNDMSKYLIELAFGIGTSDIDNGIAGEEIDLETAKRKSQNTTKSFDGSPISAIDNYIASSVPIIEQLIRAVAGSDISGLKEITKRIHLYNQLNADNITKYLDKNNEILKLLKDNEHERTLNETKKNLEISQLIFKALKLINKNIIECKNIEQFDNYISKLLDNDAHEKWSTLQDNFFELLIYNGKILDKKTLYKIYNEKYNKKLDDNLQYSLMSYLNEDEENTVNEEAGKKLEAFEFDKIYNDVKHDITQIISQAIISKPEEWPIVLNAKTRMEKLKEACDKEINAKIELICRTVLNGSSSIGEKFKAAISKHPMRAEGLKNIWARYSDDLSDRIESRIRSISGNNGNSNMLVPIKQFLTVTYPSLIAMMVTWKCVFTLLKEYTNKFPIAKLVVDKQIIEDIEITNALISLETFMVNSSNTTT